LRRGGGAPVRGGGARGPGRAAPARHRGRRRRRRARGRGRAPPRRLLLPGLRTPARRGRRPRAPAPRVQLPAAERGLAPPRRGAERRLPGFAARVPGVRAPACGDARRARGARPAPRLRPPKPRVARGRARALTRPLRREAGARERGDRREERLREPAPRVPLPAGGPVRLEQARLAGGLGGDEARPVDEARVREAVDGLADDAQAPRHETGLLAQLARRALEQRLARERLPAGRRPRAAAVRGEAAAEQHPALADDEHADPVELLGRLDRVAGAQAPAGDDRRAEPPAVDERPEQRPPGQLLEVAAGLAELGAAAEHAAGPEEAALQLVQPHAARRHVAAELAGGRVEPELLDHLRLDERQVARDPLVAPVAGPRGVAVAGDPRARGDLDLGPREGRRAGRARHVDVLDPSHRRDGTSGVGSSRPPTKETAWPSTSSSSTGRSRGSGTTGTRRAASTPRAASSASSGSRSSTSTGRSDRTTSSA